MLDRAVTHSGSDQTCRSFTAVDPERWRARPPWLPGVPGGMHNGPMGNLFLPAAAAGATSPTGAAEGK